MRRPSFGRMAVVLLLVSGVVAGYGSALVHGASFGGHCASHASSDATPP